MKPEGMAAAILPGPFRQANATATRIYPAKSRIYQGVA
jgi:hypothetical protein